MRTALPPSAASVNSGRAERKRDPSASGRREEAKSSSKTYFSGVPGRASTVFPLEKVEKASTRFFTTVRGRAKGAGISSLQIVFQMFAACLVGCPPPSSVMSVPPCQTARVASVV